MKMYLRNKNISMKAKQSNYSLVIFSLILIFLKIILVSINIFYEIPSFEILFFSLIIVFLGIHIKFLQFVLSSKGFLVTFKTILFIYLHRFLIVTCFFKGLFEYYVLKNRY
jgi:hypothetical protein